MLETVLADPILLTPEERYLTGHYLAYLLSGSRRRGLLLRRPMEPRNADRGRLLLGDDLRRALPARPRRRSATRPRCWTSGSTSAPRSRRWSSRSTWRPGAPPSPRRIFRRTAQGDRRGQPLRAEADDRRQGGAQPRADAPAAGGPAPHRPAPDRGRRRAGRALEPRRRGLADRPEVPGGGPPLRNLRGRTATRPARSCGRRSSIR